MISKNELKEYCTPTGLNLGQAEKDYLQHILLNLLSKQQANELIFKGGTALQKVYGLKRFSIDLDFTQQGKEDIGPLMGRIGKSIGNVGYAAELKELKTLGRTFLFHIQGPLYNQSHLSICSLRVEISQRESVLISPAVKEITPVYPDLQPYTLLVMQPEEILAEKVRAIMSRNKPRDVFDLGFLLNKGIKFDITFVNKKLEYFKEKFSKKLFIGKVMEKEPIWKKEISNYLPAVPAFDEIIKGIRNQIQ